jgi:hypothetical protein
MSLERRMDRIEKAMNRRERTRLYSAIATEFGMTVDELLEEAEQFLSQPLAD